MHPHLQSLSLDELADRLHDLDGRRTPVGWTPEDAVEKAAIEGRILALVTSPPGSTTYVLPIDKPIQLRSKEQQVPARLREIRAGGLYIEAAGRWVLDTHVEMQIRLHDEDEHGLRARGIVCGVERGAVLVTVAEQPSEAHERRLQRFVLELVRQRGQS